MYISVRACHGLEGDYNRRSRYARVYVRAPKGAVRTWRVKVATAQTFHCSLCSASYTAFTAPFPEPSCNRLVFARQTVTDSSVKSNNSPFPCRKSVPTITGLTRFSTTTKSCIKTSSPSFIGALTQSTIGSGSPKAVTNRSGFASFSRVTPLVPARAVR